MTMLGTIQTEHICKDCGSKICIEREEVECGLCSDWDGCFACGGTGCRVDETRVCECDRDDWSTEEPTQAGRIEAVTELVADAYEGDHPMFNQFSLREADITAELPIVAEGFAGGRRVMPIITAHHRNFRRTELMEFTHTVSGHTGGNGDARIDHEEELAIKVRVTWTTSALESGDSSNIGLEGYQQRPDDGRHGWSMYDDDLDENEALWERIREEAFERLVTRERARVADDAACRGDYINDLNKMEFDR